MTKSRFPKAVVEELLVKTGRCCCLCNEFKGGKVEVHHIVPKAERGEGTADNAIVLCFECHAEVHAYWKANPKGRKFTAAELRRHRDQWFRKFSDGGRDAEARARITKVENQLEELKAELAQSQQGVADIGTEELAKAAGPDTEARLREALELQGLHKEREAIDALYEAFRKDLEPAAKVQLHILIGNSFLALSELEEAVGHYRQALDASRAAGLQKDEAGTLCNLGLVYARRGDLEQAEEHYKQSLDIHGEIGNRRGVAYSLGNLGNVYRHLGHLDQAEERYQEVLAVSRDLGDRQSEANSLGSLGSVYFQRGDLDQAKEHHQQTLDIDREIGNRLGEANQLGSLGILAAQKDKRGDACRLLKEAAAIYAEIGAGGVNPDTVRAKLQELGCE